MTTPSTFAALQPWAPPTLRSTPLERFLSGRLVQRARKQEGQPLDLAKARKSIPLLSADALVPRGVTRTRSHIHGVPTVRYTSGNSARGTVLYFHGGAYITGSPTEISAPTVAKGGPDIVSVDYRLAPEHPYPAAQDDAMTVYRGLLETVDPSKLIVQGDSAGGGLALTLVQAIAAAELPMPAAVVAAYPWGDLSLSGPSWTTNRDRDILVYSQIKTSALWYAGERKLTDPAVSPLFGSFEGFPPTYMMVGTADMLLDDARQLAARMESAGVDVLLDEFTDAPHGFNGVPTRMGRECNCRVLRVVDAVLPRR